MADLRTLPRIAAHYRVTLRSGGREGRGTTENLSERGAMLSIELDPPLARNAAVELTIALPDGTHVRANARVRWASAVLPGVIGVEFDEPIDEDFAAHVRSALADLLDAAGRTDDASEHVSD